MSQTEQNTKKNKIQIYQSTNITKNKINKIKTQPNKNAPKYKCNKKQNEKTKETKWKKQQAGAELCQAQHQLWKMLLEELDLDQEKNNSIRLIITL